MLKRALFGLLAGGFVILFVSLGCWQAHRAIDKKAMLAAFASQQRQLTEVPSIWDPALQFRDIQLQGYLNNIHYFFLDNRFYQHQPGYELIQVLQPKQGLAILVNRGFVSHRNDRIHFPLIEPIASEVIISGKLYHPKRGIELANVDDTPDNWPKLIQTIDFDAVSNKLGYDIAPYVVMLNTDSPYALPSDWQPSIVTPARHWGYAVQWWVLAITVVIATVFFLRRT